MPPLLLALSFVAWSLAAPSPPSPQAVEAPWQARIAAVFADARAPAPSRDAALDAAVALVAATDAEQDVRALLRGAGVHDGLILPVLVVAPDAPATAAQFTAWLATQVVPQGVTHYGLAAGPGRLAAVFVRRLVTLDAPLRPPRGERLLSVAGRLRRGFAEPTFLLARPDGQIDSLRPALRRGRLQALVPFVAGDGRYALELLVRGPRGLEVAALTELEVGAGAPPLPTVRLLPGPRAADAPADAAFTPEELLLARVNTERLRLGLSPLSADPRLARTARDHARAMARAGVVAHRLPGGRDALDRVRAAGLSTARFFENVAMAPTLEAVHAELWASPSHRQALIDPLVARAGMGVAAVDGPTGRVYYVAQHLAAR